MQISLFDEQDKRKAIVYVPTEKLVTSWLNPRRTRPQEHVAKLAERIQRNGFEITRALWAYAENGHYEVFAGGTRLEAAKVAGVNSVPIVLHEGFSEDELTRLADEDNENDEYHAPVSVVDVWMDYKRLADAGWTQQRIAEAKGVSRETVKFRLMYASLPHRIVSAFGKSDVLKESHAAELCKLVNFTNLEEWRTFESVALKVIDTVLDRVGVKGPTAKQFKDEVERQNEITKMAQSIYESLDAEWQQSFVDALVSANAETKAQIQSAHNAIIKQQLKAAEERQRAAMAEQAKADAARQQAQKEAELAAARDAILAKVVCGDSRETVKTIPPNTTLILTDPPYGKGFESNRRVGIAKAGKLANDDEGIFAIVDMVLSEALHRMPEDATVILFTDWRSERKFIDVLEGLGLHIRGSYIWMKPNHGTGDLDGTFAPKHERFIHAVKGNPKLINRPPDVLTGDEFLGTEHPTEKPLDLLRTIIEACTMPGDCIADPFCGSGSVGVAAYQTDRDFWICDISEKWHSVATEAIFDAIL